MLLQLGQWVMREALRITQDLHQQGSELRHLAIKVSAIELSQPEFLLEMCLTGELFAQTGIALKLELTEQAVI